MSTSSNASRVEVSITDIKIKFTRRYGRVGLFIEDGSSKPRKLAASEDTSEMQYHVPPTSTLLPQHSLLVEYKIGGLTLTRKKRTKIGIQEILQSYDSSLGGQQEWRRPLEDSKSSELVVTLASSTTEGTRGTDSLESPTTSESFRPAIDELLEVCPFFRILIIGKSGAGKSTLINRAFGVEGAIVSHDKPGEADINKEFRSIKNPQFVLHDSLGFEHGEDDHLKEVLDFIERRDKEEHVKDKLHAIWLCLEIPTHGGRLLETGVENLLKSKIKGELGEVPLIVVFTKYDLLVNHVMLKAPDGADVQEIVEEKLQADCIKPFKFLCEQFEIPYAVVSALDKEEYQKRLPDLVQLTSDTVHKYLKDASILSGIAQRINPGLKIETIINIGKRRYWNTLASSLGFPKHTVQRRLDAIHIDIVKVWGFNDPNKFLLSLEFRTLMSNGVDYKPGGNPTKALSMGLSMVGALAGLVTALAGPAAPVVLPIAAGFVVAVWIHEAYRESQVTLQRLMTYIIDLTLITQNLFEIQRVVDLHQQPVTRRLIKSAFTAHIDTDERSRLLVSIEEYSKKPGKTLAGADSTFNKIAELIRSRRIDTEETLRKRGITNSDEIRAWARGEEEWNAGASSTEPRVVGGLGGMAR